MIKGARESLTITNMTNGTPPRGVPFLRIKNGVLGKKFVVSLVLVGNTLSKQLNRVYRHKNRPTNVLSFPIDKDEGEIFINLSYAKREAPKYRRTVKKHLEILLIHALLHLKGMTHGSTMEKTEKRLARKFGI